MFNIQRVLPYHCKNAIVIWFIKRFKTKRFRQYHIITNFNERKHISLNKIVPFQKENDGNSKIYYEMLAIIFSFGFKLCFPRFLFQVNNTQFLSFFSFVRSIIENCLQYICTLVGIVFSKRRECLCCMIDFCQWHTVYNVAITQIVLFGYFYGYRTGLA